jgi:hypothetical protein
MCRVTVLLVTVGLLLVPGCAQQPTRQVADKASSLQHWIDAELTPYLAEHLGGHPRFKGESVILVSLDGSDIEPDIDGLTRSLRDRLMDSLLSEAAVTLPWQPQQPPSQHHRRIDQVRCGRIRDADYYIGIEITRTATAQYRVSVRALDVRAGEWVSGFGKSWSGTLTPSEVHALQERRTDESLRGLRVLPFSSEHPDLAASYLANNLSCLLRQQDEEDLAIYVESLKSNQPALRTLLRLIGNNMSRYREVRVTDVKKEANFILRGEAYEVQPNLYQVWVVLHPKDSGQHLVGMDTDTYVRAPSAAAHRRSTQPPTGLPDAKPAIAAMQLVRRRSSSGDSDNCAEPPGSGGAGGAPLAGGCPLLELTVERADRVFVFVHGTKDGLSRLSSATCSSGREAPLDIAEKRTYRFPASRFSGSDWPTVYAIAVSGQDLSRQFNKLLEGLPDACSSAPGRRGEKDGTDRWLDSLDHLIAASSDHAVWTARRIP